MRTLRLALRTLARTPVVTAVAALSLGLGIGSNAAIYSIFHRMVRQDLDVPQPDRLVNLGAPGPKSGSQSCGQAGGCEQVFSYPMFRDLQNANLRVFTGIAGHRDLGANISYERRSFAQDGLLVSGTYFPVLGVQPALGRLLAPADDELSAAPAVVLAHWFWESRLGAHPSVKGKPLIVNGKTTTIIRVAPQRLNGTTNGS
ncbi:MAG: ABC transporter permease, partial [Gemmatimonadaceae bacterium]